MYTISILLFNTRGDDGVLDIPYIVAADQGCSGPVGGGGGGGSSSISSSGSSGDLMGRKSDGSGWGGSRSGDSVVSTAISTSISTINKQKKTTTVVVSQPAASTGSRGSFLITLHGDTSASYTVSVSHLTNTSSYSSALNILPGVPSRGVVGDKHFVYYVVRPGGVYEDIR